MDSSAELSAVLANRLSEIAELAVVVERFLLAFAVPADTVFQINLAFEELLTNTIKYGYPDQARHLIRVALELDSDAIDIRIVDDAAAFDPFARAAVDVTAGIDERGIGGLGIHLVKEMMALADYRRVDGRNCVTLRQPYVASPNSLVGGHVSGED